MDAARPAAIIGGIGLNPSPTANDAAIGHIITAEAVLDTVYDNIKLIIALIAKILHAEILSPAPCAIKLPIKDARPLCSIPSPILIRHQIKTICSNLSPLKFHSNLIWVDNGKLH